MGTITDRQQISNIKRRHCTNQRQPGNQVNRKEVYQAENTMNYSTVVLVLSLVILAVCVMQGDAGNRGGPGRRGKRGDMGDMFEYVIGAFQDEMEKKFDLKW